MASSTVTTKVKGLGYTNSNSKNNLRVLDASDFTIPPNEYSSVFVMTNYVETKQTLGLCGEVRLD
jgi:hypothetical protein